jgi:hypothetical protein
LGVPAYSQSAGVESLYTFNNDGNAVFRLDLFGKGQTYWYPPEWTPDPDDPFAFNAGVRDFTPAETADMYRGLEYWTAVLKPTGALSTPIVVRAAIGPAPFYNAFAITIYSDITHLPRPYEVLVTGEDPSLEPSGMLDDPLIGAHTLMGFFNIPWDTQPNSQLPETLTTLAPTMIHEVGHALGMNGGINLFNRHLSGIPYFDDDDENTPPIPGTLVFNGPIAVSVFGGPVPMANASSQEASHFGLRNGLMTHIQITNYPMFMEVELAALEDIGYTIDRRNFFGQSLYATDGTSRTIENTQGFYESRGLDAGGSWLGYDTSRPNTSLFGVGLHIYGDNYIINQQADLLAFGSGGAGIRIDGFNNTVNIPAGVTIAANGERGTGLLVSFGSGHRITSRSTISAAGPLGIAVRFDMGAPYVDEGYVLSSYGEYFAPDGTRLPINGPMVDAFNVSGALLGGASDPNGQWLSGEFVNYGGRDIAVYIGPHAHVKEINILDGAEITGDIISRWDPAILSNPLPTGNDGMTTLSFGLEKNASGEAISGSADSNFALVYRGNILGADSLNVSLEGGTLDYAGTIEAQSFTTNSGTTLLADFVDGGAATINAEEITLGSGSVIGFSPKPFAYGRELNTGANPVLELNAGATLSNNAALRQSSGGFSIGPWDYRYSGLSRNGASLAADISSQSFNHQRGGTDAAAAPLTLAMHNSVSNAAGKRLLRRFARAAADGDASSDGAREAASSLLGNYGGGNGTFPFTPNLYTETQNRQYMALAGGGGEFGDNKTGAWFLPGYHYAKHQGSRTYGIQGFGVTVGMDHWLTEIVMLGLGFGLDLPRYSGDDAETKANSTSFFIYSGIRLPLVLELEISAAYSSLRYEQIRSAPDRRFDATFGGDLFGAGITLGRSFTLMKNLILRPAVSYRFQYLRLDSYSESAGAYALRFEENGSLLHHLTIGADAAFTLNNGLWFTGQVFYAGLYGERESNAGVSFVEDPQGNTFTPPVDSLDMNSLGLSAGLGFPLIKKTLDISADYTFLFGKESFSHRIMLGLQLRF